VTRIFFGKKIFGKIFLYTVTVTFKMKGCVFKVPLHAFLKMSAGGDDGGLLPAGMPSGGRASGQRRGSSGGSQNQRSAAAASSQADGEKKYARHEARAAPQYWLPRPAAGVQQAWERTTRPLYEEPVAQAALHQRYNEHPFLLQKDVQLNRDVGKTCLSFGAHCPKPAAVRASPTRTLERAAVRQSLHAPASSLCWCGLQAYTWADVKEVRQGCRHKCAITAGRRTTATQTMAGVNTTATAASAMGPNILTRSQRA
jgi:hypothetical protein